MRGALAIAVLGQSACWTSAAPPAPRPVPRAAHPYAPPKPSREPTTESGHYQLTRTGALESSNRRAGTKLLPACATEPPATLIIEYAAKGDRATVNGDRWIRGPDSPAGNKAFWKIQPPASIGISFVASDKLASGIGLVVERDVSNAIVCASVYRFTGTYEQ